jgi:hypothetical protein
MIPGAAAAAAAVLIGRHAAWRAVFGWALLLSIPGFAAGGEFAYGRLIDQVLQAPSLGAAWPRLWELFLVGAAWGGLGFSALGVALAERPLGRVEGGIVGLAVALWLVLIHQVPVSLLPTVALILLAAVHAALALKSKLLTPAIFGLCGALSLGAGFLTAVILLYGGAQGWFGGGFPWWNLRDQWWGACGGLGIAAAMAACEGRALMPSRQFARMRYELAGVVLCIGVVIAATGNNVIQYWESIGAFTPELRGQAWLEIMLWAVVVSGVGALHVRHTYLVWPGAFSVPAGAILAMLAPVAALGIVKELLPMGAARWEITYDLFVIQLIVVAGWFGIAGMLKGTAEEPR